MASLCAGLRARFRSDSIRDSIHQIAGNKDTSEANRNNCLGMGLQLEQICKLFILANPDTSSVSYALMQRFLASFQVCGRVLDTEHFAQGRLLGPTLVSFSPHEKMLGCVVYTQLISCKDHPRSLALVHQDVTCSTCSTERVGSACGLEGNAKGEQQTRRIHDAGCFQCGMNLISDPSLEIRFAKFRQSWSCEGFITTCLVQQRPTLPHRFYEILH